MFTLCPSSYQKNLHTCVTGKMKVLELKNNPLNIQKCLLPDSEFLRKNYGQYCVVTQNLRKYIAKVGLCDVKNINETLFLDLSVTVFFEPVEKDRHDNITLKDFVLIGRPQFAKFMKVTVVFDNFLDVKKCGDFHNLQVVLRDILKLFVFCRKSLISLRNLSVNRNFGINSIIIEDVGGTTSESYRVDSNTEIKVEKCISQLKLEQSLGNKNLVEIGGCKRVYSILKETLEFSKCFDNKNIKFVNRLLLIGPPGCGKTTLVHNVTRDSKCILLEISAINVNTLTPADMEIKLRSIFEEAKIYVEHNESCVILIEDIDLMSSGKTLHAKRFVGELSSLLEEVDNMPGLMVIATTNSSEEVDPQLRRPKRLEDELEIMVPTEEERGEILEKILLHCKIEIAKELLLEISHWTPGFVGADLRLLMVEALIIYKKKGPTTILDQSVLKDSFREALTKVIPSALRGTVGLCTSNVITFSDIGGLEEIKKIFDLAVKQQLENPEKFRKFGVPLTKGILLYGPPGCAKTTLVKALAKECNTTFLATSAADLYSPYVGDAERKISLLFTQARIGSPSILFIDEIDAVVGSKSGDRSRGVQERILSTLLIEMDGVGLKVNTQRNTSNLLGDGREGSHGTEVNSSVIVIGATNRPQMLDDALKRPGRFDRLLYVPPPDESERFRILNKLTEKIPLDESVDLKALANLTQFYSGADLKNLCQEAGLHALRCTEMTANSVSQSDFNCILKEYKPSLNESVVKFYESFQSCSL